MYKNMKKNMSRQRAVISALLLTISFDIFAALPVVAPPTGVTVTANWLDLIKGYFKDGSEALILVMAVVGFVWIAWINVSKFNEARKGQAEWGDVGVTGVISAVVMIFITYFLNSASTVFA